MAWCTRFLAVPIEQLNLDEQMTGSPKATPEQMRRRMAHTPKIYEKLGAGASVEDFRAMRYSPNAETRAVGEAYHHLFSPDGAEHRLEAELVDGERLVVSRGRHRVEAAREIGLPYVPVHVRAENAETLEAASRSYEASLGSSAPEVVRAQRELDAAHRAERSTRARTSYRTLSAPSSMPPSAQRGTGPADSRESRDPVRGRSRG